MKAAKVSEFAGQGDARQSDARQSDARQSATPTPVEALFKYSDGGKRWQQQPNHQRRLYHTRGVSWTVGVTGATSKHPILTTNPAERPDLVQTRPWPF